MIFSSFMLAGFECATGYNIHRQWMDQIAATHHDLNADSDYRLVKEQGMDAVREAVRWPIVNPAEGVYDFSSIDRFIDAADKYGIEIIWDLFHFGFPNDVDLFETQFPGRFARYCREAALYIRARTYGTCYFTPINEPSFFSWAAGEAGQFAPHLADKAWELKVNLARAAIAGINAIWRVDSTARIVNVDALCRTVAPMESPELEPRAGQFNSCDVFQSWDMLAGRLLPELGGSPDHLDIVGINYYWTNQWELENAHIPLRPEDPRCVSLSDLTRSVWQRYGAEMLITETSHVNEHRAPWIRELTDECLQVLDEGIPLHGACLYPILGMPEWHTPDDYTHMGLWDLVHENGSLRRVLYEPMARALGEANALLNQVAPMPSGRYARMM